MCSSMSSTRSPASTRFDLRSRAIPYPGAPNSPNRVIFTVGTIYVLGAVGLRTKWQHKNVRFISLVVITISYMAPTLGVAADAYMTSSQELSFRGYDLRNGTACACQCELRFLLWLGGSNYVMLRIWHQ